MQTSRTGLSRELLVSGKLCVVDRQSAVLILENCELLERTHFSGWHNGSLSNPREFITQYASLDVHKQSTLQFRTFT